MTWNRKNCIEKVVCPYRLDVRKGKCKKIKGWMGKTADPSNHLLKKRVNYERKKDILLVNKFLFFLAIM